MNDFQRLRQLLERDGSVPLVVYKASEKMFVAYKISPRISEKIRIASGVTRYLAVENAIKAVEHV